MEISPRVKQVPVSVLLYALCIVVVLAVMTSVVLIYIVPQSFSVTERLKAFLPYPAVMIEYRSGITYRALADNISSVKRFYEAQDFAKIGMRIDFSTEMGKKRFEVRKKEVFNKMIEDEAIVLLAKKRGINVSAEEASQAITRKLEEYGTGKEVVQDLERLYGWALTDFQEKVVIPGLYQEKLRERFVQEVDATAVGKKNIEAAQKALRARTSFAEVARIYSEGNTAGNGGALGWFTLENLAFELREPVAKQTIGVPGDVIESELGFHIILVEEIKMEDQQKLYRLSQIFTRKVVFADWLTERMREFSIVVLSPEYRWNKAEARVEFKQQEMRDFEKELFETANEETSFFF